SMSQTTPLDQRLELRDASGNLIGYFVPAPETSNGAAPEPPATSWEQRCRELTEERAKLLAEIEQLRTERDQFAKAVYALTKKDYIIIDTQAILKSVGKGPSTHDLLDEIERTYGGK